MEFEPYGPLAESKEYAINKKTRWATYIILISIGILSTLVTITLVQNNKNKPLRKTNEQDD
ncbi:MAG: hypothetical protein RIQ61_518 [Bacteroidota bacterium]|jgi:hypothetical protein